MRCASRRQDMPAQEIFSLFYFPFSVPVFLLRSLPIIKVVFIICILFMITLIVPER